MQVLQKWCSASQPWFLRRGAKVAVLAFRSRHVCSKSVRQQQQHSIPAGHKYIFWTVPPAHQCTCITRTFPPTGCLQTFYLSLFSGRFQLDEPGCLAFPALGSRQDRTNIYNRIWIKKRWKVFLLVYLSMWNHSIWSPYQTGWKCMAHWRDCWAKKEEKRAIMAVFMSPHCHQI